MKIKILILLFCVTIYSKECEKLFTDIKIAYVDRSSMSSALKILHDAYVKKGYMKPSSNGLRETKYTYIETTKTVIAYHLNKAIATMSLIGGSELPTSEIYDLSSYKGKIAEVSSLAILDDYKGQGLQLKMTMFLLKDILEFDYLVITVNPKAEKYYIDNWGFITIGLKKDYDFVGGAPGVIMIKKTGDWK